MNDVTQNPESKDEPKLELSSSSMFPSWMAGQRSSIVLTTYQTAKLFLIGLQPNGRLSIFERTLERGGSLSGYLGRQMHKPRRV